MHLEALFTPADFARLNERDLGGTACVVFDVLRATSTMVTALANGAVRIRPVATLDEALRERRDDPGVLLAGERNGLRIRAESTGGVEFDLGNSPREFTAARVAGRKVVMTTTNGTRALRACGSARLTVAASFLNLSAVAAAIRRSPLSRVIVVGSGTGEAAAYEDTLAAGALVEVLQAADAELADSAWIALAAWQSAAREGGLAEAIGRASNARRLQALTELAPDVEYCLRRDVLPVVPRLCDGKDLILTDAQRDRAVESSTAFAPPEPG